MEYSNIPTNGDGLKKVVDFVEGPYNIWYRSKNGTIHYFGDIKEKANFSETFTKDNRVFFKLKQVHGEYELQGPTYRITISEGIDPCQLKLQKQDHIVEVIQKSRKRLHEIIGDIVVWE